ncbi:hypothetical protein AOLI_G00244280 [Acnodon oligacanthus]
MRPRVPEGRCVACILQLRNPVPLFIASQCFKQGQAAVSVAFDCLEITAHLQRIPLGSIAVLVHSRSSAQHVHLPSFRPSLTAPYGVRLLGLRVQSQLYHVPQLRQDVFGHIPVFSEGTSVRLAVDDAAAGYLCA